MQRAHEIVATIDANREALEERRWYNATHPEVMVQESPPRKAPVPDEVVYKVTEDALAAEPAIERQDLQAVLEDMAEMFGTAVGELERRIAKLEEHNRTFVWEDIKHD